MTGNYFYNYQRAGVLTGGVTILFPCLAMQAAIVRGDDGQLCKCG